MDNFKAGDDDQFKWRLITIPKKYKTGLKGKKIKFLIDENIPAIFVEVLKEALHFSITTISEQSMKGRSDEAIRIFAKSKNLILLTTDKDFLNERIHPTPNCNGIFCFECGPQDLNKMVESFTFFYTHFLHGSSNDFWMNKKILIKKDNFLVRAYHHRLFEYEFKIESSKVYMRKVK